MKKHHKQLRELQKKLARLEESWVVYGGSHPEGEVALLRSVLTDFLAELDQREAAW